MARVDATMKVKDAPHITQTIPARVLDINVQILCNDPYNPSAVAVLLRSTVLLSQAFEMPSVAAA